MRFGSTVWGSVHGPRAGLAQHYTDKARCWLITSNALPQNRSRTEKLLAYMRVVGMNERKC